MVEMGEVYTEKCNGPRTDPFLNAIYLTTS